MFSLNILKGKSMETEAGHICSFDIKSVFYPLKRQRQRQLKTRKSSGKLFKAKKVYSDKLLSKCLFIYIYSGPSEFSFCFLALRNSSTASHLCLLSRKTKLCKHEFHICICVCVFVYLCICVFVHLCICVFVYMCICVFVSLSPT